MNTLKNRVQLIGHIGADPEMSITKNGNKLVRLNIAVTERKPANGSLKENTQWHKLSIWGKLAEQAESQLHKGNYILAEGKLTCRTYADPAGNTRYYTEVHVSRYFIINKQKNKPAASAAA